jgi:hypothetical protein
MLALYIVLGLEWAVWLAGVASTSVFVKDCTDLVKPFFYKSPEVKAAGLCLSLTRCAAA